MEQLRVFIVEDDALSAQLLEHMLIEIGCTVVGCEARGEAALAALAFEGADLAIMDIGLKGEMDGIDTAIQLRSDRGLPVLFLTAADDDDTIKRAQNADPFGYLLKPIGPTLLRATILTAISRLELERTRKRLAEESEEQRERLAARNRELLDSEARLSASQKRYRELFDRAPVGYLTLDGRGIISEANMTLGGYLATDRSDLVGKSLDSLVVAEDGDCLRLQLETLLAEGEVPSFAARIASEKAGPKWVSIEMGTLNSNGGGPLYLVTLSDMDERVAMENGMMQAEKAALAANRAKSDFLASMSHELRTPLNSIIGFSQLLAAGSSTLSELQRGWVQDIKSSGDHLMGMLSDILDLSKIEAGKIDLHRKPFDIHSTIEKLVETMRSISSKKDVSIELEITSEIGVLDADEIRVRQMLYNLLSNAIKFTGEGRAVGLRAQGMGDMVLLEVWDQGIGIAAGNLGRIFEPFEQVRQPDSSLQGTGLGLPITRKLVELHGGRIEVSSEEGKGSRFLIALPGRSPERRSRTEASEAAPTGERRVSIEARLLVVEDNPVNRKLIKAMLDSHGYQASFAVSGEEAVTLASERHFDLILMDVNLPGIDGVEAMKRIRKAGTMAAVDIGPAPQVGAPALADDRERRSPSAQGAIIALTAHAMKSDIERFIAEGMDDVITKPIDMVRLMFVLEKFLGRTAEGSGAERGTGMAVDLPSPSPGAPAVPGATIPAGGLAVLDEERGLLLLGGNRSLLAEMLGMFATSFAGFPSALHKALEEGNYTEARRLLHGLKGSASNLGIPAVEAAAKILEHRVAEGEHLGLDDPALAELLGHLAAAIASIGSYLQG
ncbi:MAG: response regulator [Spirochaetota bacterium]